MLKHMEVVPVVSSNLRGVGYDESRCILVIEFKKGLYKYDGVPSNIHAGLMAASSKGTFHAENIKSKFQCERLD